MLDHGSRSSSRIGRGERAVVAVVLLLVLVTFVAPASATSSGRDGDLLVEAQQTVGTQLWMTSADGRHARLIFTAGRCAHFDGAQFLPSGNQVVVQESFGCVPPAWGLVLVSTDGRGSRRLSVHSRAPISAGIPGSVAISPDGRTLAYGHYVYPKSEIDFVSLRSGRTVRSVTSPLPPPTAWLPTERLVSMYPDPNTESGFGGIGVADLNGSLVRKIGVTFANVNTVLAGRSDLSVPSVVPSPDASRFVVFGGQITSSCTPSTLAHDGNGLAYDARPSARPDDQGQIDRPSDLYLVSARGGKARRLTHNGGELNAPLPVWSPDGTQIILTSYGPTNQVLDLKTGRARTIRLQVPARNPTILDWQAVSG